MNKNALNAIYLGLSVRVKAQISGWNSVYYILYVKLQNVKVCLKKEALLPYQCTEKCKNVFSNTVC